MGQEGKQSGAGFLVGVIVGGVVGAAVALLTSPKNGAEVRTLLDEKTATSRELLTVKTQEVREKAEPMMEEWIKIASEKSAPILEKASPVINKLKEKTNVVVEEVEATLEAELEKADQLVAEAEAELHAQQALQAEEIETAEAVEVESTEETGSLDVAPVPVEEASDESKS